MLKTIIGLICVSGVCCAAVEPNYLDVRAAAARLKSEEALPAFIALADGPFSDAQKADALERASTLALEQKQYDQALELAKKITVPAISKAVRMRVMSARREWEALIVQFKDENIDAWWPDYLNSEAFLNRGLAYAARGDGTNAVADLRKAADTTRNDSTRGFALNNMGSAYRGLLKDDARAIAAYRETYLTKNDYKRFAAVIAVAEILARQNKLDEALAELRTIDLDKVGHPGWRGSLLAAYGDILAKQGKKAEAIAKYREAAGLKDLDASQKAAYEKAIKDLAP